MLWNYLFLRGLNLFVHSIVNEKMLSFRPLGNLKMDFSKSAPMHVQRTTMINTHARMPPLDNVIVDLVLCLSLCLSV